MIVTASISSEPLAIGTSTVLLAEAATILVALQLNGLENTRFKELDAACALRAKSFC